MNVIEVVEQVIVVEELNDAIEYSNILISDFFIDLMNEFKFILPKILNFGLFFLTFTIDFLGEDIKISLRQSLKILKSFILIMSPFKHFTFFFFTIWSLSINPSMILNYLFFWILFWKTRSWGEWTLSMKLTFFSLLLLCFFNFLLKIRSGFLDFGKKGFFEFRKLFLKIVQLRYTGKLLSVSDRRLQSSCSIFKF